MDFIECKAKEEAKAHTLIKAGYDGSGPDSEAFSSIFFQNANNSVRVSDEFMRAYESDGEFTTYTVKGHEPVASLQGARDHAQDRRGHLAVRRSRHAVRHHHQPLAHQQEHGAHQRLQPLLGVHVPGQLGLQPGQLQPDEVRHPGGQSSTFPPTGTPSRWSSRPWRSWWTTPATRPRPSRATPTTTGRWAWATPTWARC